MPRRLSRRSLLLTLLILLPALPLALLCRGRTPSRFDPANLPPWERSTLARASSRRRERIARAHRDKTDMTHRRKPLGG